MLCDRCENPGAETTIFTVLAGERENCKLCKTCQENFKEQVVLHPITDEVVFHSKQYFNIPERQRDLFNLTIEARWVYDHYAWLVDDYLENKKAPYDLPETRQEFNKLQREVDQAAKKFKKDFEIRNYNSHFRTLFFIVVEYVENILH